MALIRRASLIKRGFGLATLAALGLAMTSACVVTMGSDTEDDDDSAPSRSGTGGGTSQSGGSGGTTDPGGSGGTDETGGTAGSPASGGTAGAPETGGAGGEPPAAGAAGQPAVGGSGDAGSPAVVGGAAGCGAGYTPQSGTIQRDCAVATDNECDASSNTNAALPNGAFGNGFDDDCDGLVDEGCLCPTGSFAGDSHGDCWLVPASQVDPANDNEPVGWCQDHARGSRVCVSGPSGPEWSGECRGARMPRVEDVCSSVAADYNCDGVENNAPVDCACVDIAVECPTAVLEAEPYPDPVNLPAIDGSAWVLNGVASNWTWTVTGGDCDNILPHPSFAVYDGADSTVATQIGEQQSGLGQNGGQNGIVVQNGPDVIYPALALSGDYLVQAEFEVDGTVHECTVKVASRADGIRAEACWNPMPNDVDLHMGRLQGTGSDPRGWMGTGGNSDDCYYARRAPDWGYTDSSVDACHGWGSRQSSANCANPRLDRDNVYCTTSVTDPTDSSFCAAENINIDNPGDGDRFAIALNFFSESAGDARVHLNVYCNGERRLAMGYDPVTDQQYPILMQSGSDSSGDFWQAAVVEALVNAQGEMFDCEVMPIHSSSPDAGRDGSLDYCVDQPPLHMSPDPWRFTTGGGFPYLGDPMTVGSVSTLCRH